MANRDRTGSGSMANGSIRSRAADPAPGNLRHMPGLSDDVQSAVETATDQAWIDVIQQMDNIYADLVRYQVELENKNAQLEEAQASIEKAYDELHVAHEGLKTAQRQLIQSEKMASLGRLVAGVAHELNNPISFVYANIHALTDYHRKLSEYIGAIHDGASADTIQQLRTRLKIDYLLDDLAPLLQGSTEGAERVSQIVSDLRRFTNPGEPVYESLNLTHVVRRVCEWVSRVETDFPRMDLRLPDSIILTNSEIHVQQILINLVQNAVDALLECTNPCITIECRTGKQYQHLTVRDNGPGIRSDILENVFDPFFTTKPVGSGTGLGLWISYGLANSQCGGNLQADNHPDGGAVMTLSLPLDAPHNQALQKAGAN